MAVNLRLLKLYLDGTPHWWFWSQYYTVLEGAENFDATLVVAKDGKRMANSNDVEIRHISPQTQDQEYLELCNRALEMMVREETRLSTATAALWTRDGMLYIKQHGEDGVVTQRFSVPDARPFVSGHAVYEAAAAARLPLLYNVTFTVHGTFSSSDIFADPRGTYTTNDVAADSPTDAAVTAYEQLLQTLRPSVSGDTSLLMYTCSVSSSIGNVVWTCESRFVSPPTDMQQDAKRRGARQLKNIQ